MFYRFVTKGGKLSKEAERLLTVYKSGYPEPGNPVERHMVGLAGFFRLQAGKLHERIHCMTLFNRVLVAALRGEVLKYRIESKETPLGKTVYEIIYYGNSKRPKAKSAAK
jgi:hypothetical protein